MSEDKKTVKKPMTGNEYLESLDDGREVYIFGERVKNVTTHPAFRNSARMTARMYDAMHDESKASILRSPTDTGSGGYTQPSSKHHDLSDDLVASRDAIAEWQRIGTVGWAARQITKPALSLQWALCQSFLVNTKAMLAAGTKKPKKTYCTGITPL